MPNGFAEGLGRIGSSIARGITAQSERQRQEEDLFASLLLGAAQAPEELESLFRTLAKERTGRDLPAIQRAPKAFGLRRVKDVPNLFAKYPQHGDLTVDELLRIVPRAREEFDVGAREEREREEKERRDAEVQRQVAFFTQRYPGVPLPSHLVKAMKVAGLPIRTKQVDVTAPLTLGGRGAPIEAIREQAGKTVQIPTGEREDVEDLPTVTPERVAIFDPTTGQTRIITLPAGTTSLKIAASPIPDAPGYLTVVGPTGRIIAQYPLPPGQKSQVMQLAHPPRVGGGAAALRPVARIQSDLAQAQAIEQRMRGVVAGMTEAQLALNPEAARQHAVAQAKVVALEAELRFAQGQQGAAPSGEAPSGSPVDPNAVAKALKDGGTRYEDALAFAIAAEAQGVKGAVAAVNRAYGRGPATKSRGGGKPSGSVAPSPAVPGVTVPRPPGLRRR